MKFGLDTKTGEYAFSYSTYTTKTGEVGRIREYSHRQCAKCGYAPCLVVEFNDGKTKKPCQNHATKQSNSNWIEN